MAGKKLWYIVTGFAAAVIVIIALAVAAGGGGGSGGGGGRGQTVDYGQFQADVQLLSYLSLSAFDGYDLNQNDIGASPILPSDCRQAVSEVSTLRAHTDTWPTILRVPMSQAENDFAAAATACSSGDFATMKADMTKGDGYLTATNNAFAAHCAQSDNDLVRWQC